MSGLSVTTLSLRRLNISSSPVSSVHHITSNWQLAKECARPRNRTRKLQNTGLDTKTKYTNCFPSTYHAWPSSIRHCWALSGCCLLHHGATFWKPRINFYHKVPKFSNARKLCCNLPKIQTKGPNLRVFHQKNVNGIASSLIWVCTVCPDISVQKLRIIMVPYTHQDSRLQNYIWTKKLPY